MAILRREEFFSRLEERLRGDTSDEGISFLEDMTDTYNDLERRANGDGVDWEARCRELDESWKKRYRHRFFSGTGTDTIIVDSDTDKEEYNPEEIKVDDLFEDEEEK